MNVFQYIAENNPDAAYEVCKKYGHFDIQSLDELSQYLEHICSTNGEDTFKEVISLHPDKQILGEVFGTLNNPPKDCGCNKSESTIVPTETTKLNASGGGFTLVNQTNTYILIGAVIVSLAIISLNK
jgi:hypothetical protein